MAKKIKCIVKRPDEQFGHMTWVSDSLENLQKTVGGYIETVSISDHELVLIVNEEGKLRDMPYNFSALCSAHAYDAYVEWREQLFGTVIVCGTSPTKDTFEDIPIDFNEWKSLLCEWGN
jgi:hypothetical protein